MTAWDISEEIPKPLRTITGPELAQPGGRGLHHAALRSSGAVWKLRATAFQHRPRLDADGKDDL